MPMVGKNKYPIPKSQILAEQEFESQKSKADSSLSSYKSKEDSNRSIRLASMNASLKQTIAERAAADEAANRAAIERTAADQAAKLAASERIAAERAANRASSERAAIIAEAEMTVDEKLRALDAQETQEVVADADKMRGESLMRPLVARRAAINATGYAVISIQHHSVQAQQRLLAIRASKLDAYRGLSEQVFGQYLDATTTVADMVIKSDVFRTKVEGIIYGAKVVSINPVGDDTYETTLSLDGGIVEDLRRYYAEQLASIY
jgi:hypothetical protein